MSQQRRPRRKKVPAGVWILIGIFAALFIIPLASSGGAADNTIWAVLGCLGGLVGFIFLIARFVVPKIGKAARRGMQLAKDFDQQLTTQQRKAVVAQRSVVRTVTSSPQNVIVTPLSTRQPAAELPLPDRWEQIRRQMFLLGFDDAKATPKTAVLNTMIVIEDPSHDQQRTVAGRLLIEQLLTKADEVALCVITSTHVFDNLPSHFDNIYLVGGPLGRRKLPKELQAYYGDIADEESADAFCQTLIDHGDHAIVNLSTYASEQQALRILSNLLYSLFGRVSTSTRQCILVLDNAHDLLPTDQHMGRGLFSHKGEAQSLCNDLLQLLAGGKETGLYTYLLTAQPTLMDIRAIFECKFWIVNKVLSDEEAKLVQGRMLAEPHEIARLKNREALFTEDIGTSPIRSIVLRPSDTTHMEPAWARPQERQAMQEASQQTRPAIPSPMPPLPEKGQTHEVHGSTQSRSQATPPPREEPTPTPTTQNRATAIPEEEEKIIPEMLEYVWYVRYYAADFYSAKMLAYPEEDLYSILEALGLADRYEEHGRVFSEHAAQALMHRTEDLSKEGEKIALEVRARILAFQDEQLVPSVPTTIDERTDDDEEYEDEEEEAPVTEHLRPLVPSSKATPSTSVPAAASVFQMTLDWDSPWNMPDTRLLEYAKRNSSDQLGPDPEELAARIREVLTEFRVYAEVRAEDIKIGPTVIRFGIRPTGKVLMTKDAEGRPVPATDSRGNIRYETRTRTSRIMALQNDIALVLEAKSIRMEAPVPGEPYVGVEIPNPNARTVTLREILEWPEYKSAARKSKLVFGLGQDVAGQVRIADLAKMPHLLIAGATGSGKSVLVNSIIASFLYNASPDEIRFLMVDPKMVELKMYDGIPHLMQPVVVEVDKVVPLLKGAIGEMERRYQLFSKVKVRNLEGYRKLRATRIAQGDTTLQNLPSIVIIIDELADLMMAAPEEVEGMICRLAQLARATGIHLVIATQRPSVDVITGLIKANIPARISFMVSSAVDSRTVIDMGGAERLLGRGDMLFLPAEAGRPERLQGAFLSDDEAAALAHFWRSQARVQPSASDPADFGSQDEQDGAQEQEDQARKDEEEHSQEHTNTITPQEAPASPSVIAHEPEEEVEPDPLAFTSPEIRTLIERIASGEHLRVGKEHTQGRKLSKDEIRLLVAAYLFRHGMISTTGVQGRFHVGYNIANEIIEDLEDMGILGPYQGKAQPRSLTPHRGGDNLPVAFKAIRDLIDQRMGKAKGRADQKQADDGENEDESPRTDQLAPPVEGEEALGTRTQEVSLE